MTKYIVKNCPALVDLLSAEKEELLKKKYCINASEYCSDITDCMIKKVVDKCKAEYEAAGRQLDGISEEVLQQLPQLYFFRGSRNSAYLILQMFQVQEVE